MSKSKVEGKTLESHKLEYEDVPFKKPKISKNKKTVAKKNKRAVASNRPNRLVVFVRFIVSKCKDFYNHINVVVNKALHPKKNAKKLTKNQQKEVVQQRKNVIMGIGLLLVIVSIIYSTYIVRTFVNTGGSLVALAPQVIFAVATLIKAFSKLYK